MLTMNDLGIVHWLARAALALVVTAVLLASRPAFSEDPVCEASLPSACFSNPEMCRTNSSPHAASAAVPVFVDTQSFVVRGHGVLDALTVVSLGAAAWNNNGNGNWFRYVGSGPGTTDSVLWVSQPNGPGYLHHDSCVELEGTLLVQLLTKGVDSNRPHAARFDSNVCQTGSPQVAAITVFENSQWSWSGFPDPSGDEPRDLISTMAHEFGHALGLAHPCFHDCHCSDDLNPANPLKVDPSRGSAERFGCSERRA